MTLKNSFCNPVLILDAIRKQIWIFIVASVALFFVLPIAVLLEIQEALRLFNSEQFVTNITSVIQSFFSLNNVTLIVIMSAFAIVSGIGFFYYLHDKKKIDFFHSLPIGSKNLFFVNYLAGLLSVIIPYIVFYLIAIGTTAAYGSFQYLGFAMVAKGFLLPLIYFINFYTITVLAGVLTGNIIIHGCISIYLLAVIPVICLELHGLMSSFFKTYVAISPWVESLIVSISPVYCLFGISEEINWGSMVIYLIISMFALMLAAFLYSKRQGESAGKAIAFSWFKPLVKYPLIIMAAIGFGLLFHITGDDNRYLISFWLVFGTIVGGVLISRLMEAIFAFDIKAIKKHWLNLVVSLAAVGCIFAFFALDLGGYDSYVPNTGEVAEVCIDIDGINMYGDDVEYNSPTSTEYNYLQGRESIKNSINIAKNGIANLDEVGSQMESITQEARSAKMEEGYIIETQSSQHNEEKYTTCVKITYVLNNGKIVERLYPVVNKVDTLKDVEAIINTEEYKDNALRFLSHEDLNIDSFIFAETEYSIYTDAFSPEGKKKFIDAYAEDVKALDLTTMSTEKVIGVTHFTNLDNAASESQYTEITGKDILSITVPIYLSYTNTLGVLNEMGYDIETYGTLDVSKIKKIIMNVYTPGSNDNTEKLLSREEYADLLASTSSDYQLGYNYFTAAANYYVYSVECALNDSNSRFITIRQKTVNWNI